MCNNSSGFFATLTMKQLCDYVSTEIEFLKTSKSSEVAYFVFQSQPKTPKVNDFSLTFRSSGFHSGFFGYSFINWDKTSHATGLNMLF